MLRLCLLAVAVLDWTTLAPAQWPRVAWPTLPRTANGKVNLNAPRPRAADGCPDLSGLWEMYSESGRPTLLMNLASDLKPGAVAFLPSAEAIFKEREATNFRDHPRAQCLPPGILEKNTVPAPYKTVQTLPRLLGWALGR